jgi:divalent metal cation (Fe/Co/Zn/Cd) transporter
MQIGASSCQTCGCDERSCEACSTPAKCSDCSACCCNGTHQSWRLARIGKGIRIEYLSSGWMIVEVLGAIGFGLIAGSFALLAFGGDSLIELISGIAVLTGLRKDSSISGGDDLGESKRTEQFTSALLFVLLPVIGLGAAYSYVSGLRPESSPLGIAIAVGAVIMMPYLYIQKKRIGRETRSLSLSIDAIESVTCLFMAVALLGGLLAEYFLGLWWVDYLATGIILAFVAREAVESYNELHE